MLRLQFPKFSTGLPQKDLPEVFVAINALQDGLNSGKLVPETGGGTSRIYVDTSTNKLIVVASNGKTLQLSLT